MHIRLDVDSLTLDDLEALENARFDPTAGVWSQVRTIFARFAHESEEEDSPRIPYEEALTRVGALTMRQISTLFEALTTALEEVSQQAIPPTKSGK
jgi:hypothetical protein